VKNYFQATKDNPYHLSIGAVLLNGSNEVACHYFDKAPEGAPGEYKDLKDVYLLMRETMEIGETIEQTLHRGLLEEFGATGEIMSFLGSQETAFKGNEVDMKKTTLYFLVRMKSFDITKRSHEDLEGDSQIVFLTLDDCIMKMEELWKRLKQETLNESMFAKRAREYISNHGF